MIKPLPKSMIATLKEGDEVQFRLKNGQVVPARVHCNYPPRAPRNLGTGRFRPVQYAITIQAEGNYFLCNNLIGLDRIYASQT